MPQLDITPIQQALANLAAALTDFSKQVNTVVPLPAPTPAPVTLIPLPWAASPPNTTVASPSGIQIGVSATTLTLAPGLNNVDLTAVASRGNFSAIETVRFASANPELFEILTQDPVQGTATLQTFKTPGSSVVLVTAGDAVAAIAVEVKAPYIPPKPLGVSAIGL